MVLQRQQRGMGLLAWIIVIAIFGFFLTLGIKSFPIYMNHYKVVSIMKLAANQPDVANASPTDIRKSMDRRFDVDMVNYIQPEDVKVINDKSGKGRILMVDYEVRIPMFYNIDAVYKFREEIPLGVYSGGAGD